MPPENACNRTFPNHKTQSEHKLKVHLTANVVTFTPHLADLPEKHFPLTLKAQEVSPLDELHRLLG